MIPAESNDAVEPQRHSGHGDKRAETTGPWVHVHAKGASVSRASFAFNGLAPCSLCLSGELGFAKLGLNKAAVYFFASALGTDAQPVPWPDFNEDEVAGLTERYSAPEWNGQR